MDLRTFRGMISTGTVPEPGSPAAPEVQGHSDTWPAGWAAGHCSGWAGRGRCCSSGTATFTTHNFPDAYTLYCTLVKHILNKRCMVILNLKFLEGSISG